MNATAADSFESPSGAHIFRVYLAGAAPNSAQALENLKTICQRHLPGSHQIEVIDVLQEPMRALQEVILVTPTVVRVHPEPELQIIGNLSEEAEVLRMLGLTQREAG